MKQLKPYFYIVLMCSLFVATGCTTLDWNGLNDMEIRPSLGIPIGRAELTMTDLIQQKFSDNLTVDTASRNCYIVWHQDDMDLEFDLIDLSKGATVATQFDLKDYIPVLSSVTSSQFITIPKGEKIQFNSSFSYNFNYNEASRTKNMRIDSMLVSTSLFDCNYELNNLNIGKTMPLVIKISFPGIAALKHYSIEHIVDGSNGHFNDYIKNYLIHFINDNNLTAINVSFEITSDGTLRVNKESSIAMQSSFNLVDAKAAWGYFEKEGEVSSAWIHKELPTDFFENPNIANNRLLFTNPQINIGLTSNIGIPLRLKIDSISARSADNERVYAEFNGESYREMNLEAPNTLYGETYHSFKFDRQNGCTHRLFQIFPKDVSYKWSVSTRKDGSNNLTHFLVHPIKFKMELDVLLPLQLDPSSYFTYRDTLEADFKDLLSVDSVPNYLDIETLSVYLDNENRMPLSLLLDADFMDENGEVLQSRNNIVIPSAPVNSKGEATEATTSTTKLEFTHQELNEILRTKKILLKVRIQGETDDSMIKIMMDDRATIRLSLFAKSSVKVNQ